jgi:hypothetical protein
MFEASEKFVAAKAKVLQSFLAAGIIHMYAGHEKVVHAALVEFANEIVGADGVPEGYTLFEPEGQKPTIADIEYLLDHGVPTYLAPSGRVYVGATPEAQGSGSERYREAETWTGSVGAGLTDDTRPVANLPTQAEADAIKFHDAQPDSGAIPATDAVSQ